MGSVDRSRHKRGLHKHPPGSRRTAQDHPAPEWTPVRRRLWRCLNRRIVGHGPPAHRSGKLRRHAAREGRLSQKPRKSAGTFNPGGPHGKPPAPARTRRRAPGSGRGTKASEPSEPPPSRRSSREQWRCASMAPLSRWMASTCAARRPGRKHHRTTSARPAVYERSQERSTGFGLRQKKADDSASLQPGLHRGITPRIARGGVDSPAQLGRHRWVVERRLSWLLGCRRLRAVRATRWPPPGIVAISLRIDLRALTAAED